jgi:hypothetical protein
VSKVLRQLVGRPLATLYQETEEELEPKQKQTEEDEEEQEGDLPYTWMYGVIVRANGLYVYGNI